MYSIWIECNVLMFVWCFLSVSESKRNIDNDMYLSIYIYFSKFIESLFPTPVLKPLNKKKQHIPCQDLKKNTITFGWWYHPIHICDALKQNNLQPPKGPFQPLAAVVEAPQIQLRHRRSHRSHHRWVIPEQHRCRPAALHKRVAPCWGHPGVLRDAAAGWCHWEEGFCCSLLNIVLLIRP